ncbi:S16 family serine protease [Gracilibacillus kekensis]|uniref:Lon protease (S16) C-terminal proteolytic domain-containing protein n=1 Tax=Gracilibacillus kekensis TaxID=1027249 RepID=A0A1M7JXJ1_9BACI|nr:S16 family serine protease [Gracilibacillus kekensis]SHM57736.1 Lon protease (S16) C-terminal proteolytic domain-containing protein [Gracilibacillus kekensis]
MEMLMNKNRNAPFWFVCIIYFTELYYYLSGMIDTFLFVFLLLANFIVLLFFNSKIWKLSVLERPFLISLSLALFIFGFDFPVPFLNPYPYIITTYNEPEQIIEDTEIYSLGVSYINITYVNDKQELIQIVEADPKKYEVRKISNKNKYINKNTRIFKMLGIPIQSEFNKMSKAVTEYLDTTPPSIKEYFKREKMYGNSSGLSLILSAMISQGEIENNIPIAVTGAIDKDGEVYPIGSLKEKMLISVDAGFELMMLPTENLQEAKEIQKAYNLPLEVINVDNVAEAKELIKELNSKS